VLATCSIRASCKSQRFLGASPPFQACSKVSINLPPAHAVYAVQTPETFLRCGLHGDTFPDRQNSKRTACSALSTYVAIVIRAAWVRERGRAP